MRKKIGIIIFAIIMSLILVVGAIGFFCFSLVVNENDGLNSFLSMYDNMPELDWEMIEVDGNSECINYNNSNYIDIRKIASKIDCEYNIVDDLIIENDRPNILSIGKNSHIILKDNDVCTLDNETFYINDNLYVPIEEFVKICGYKVISHNDNYILYKQFSTKRLIVKSSSKLDTCGAIGVAEGYNDIHIYQYKTIDDTIKAFDYYLTLPNVEYVEEDKIWSVNDSTINDTFVNGRTDSFSYKTWGASAIGADRYSDYLIENVNLQNLPEVVVAVLDTGIDSTHSWFANRIADGSHSYVGDSALTDQHGHGTHVSGIITDLTLPNVKILPIAVMGSSGYGTTSNIIAGISLVINLKNSGTNICAINMSIGSEDDINGNSNALYSEYINNAYVNNILSVVSSGNESDDATKYVPANVENAITVSAVGDYGGSYSFADFSNFGSCVDICAPGYMINSAKVGGGTQVDSGTSMAAPHVCGAIALLYSDANNNYSMSEVEGLLFEKAIDLGTFGKDIYYGYGLVNIGYAYVETINDVVFSRDNAVCTESFYLTFSHQDPTVEIYYTLDGSTPDWNSNLYYSPIVINTTTIVKTIAYKFVDDVIVGCSNISVKVYTFSGQDIESAYVVSNDGEILSYNGVLQDIIVPSLIRGITITSIGENAFYGKNITSITLPATVLQLKRTAFLGCSNLQTIQAPGVVNIAYGCFAYCNSLLYVNDTYFPELTFIDQNAFYNCNSLNNITLSKLQTIGSTAFNMSTQAVNLTSVNMPNVKYIGSKVFYGCEYISSISMPNVEIIGSYSFKNCKISSLTLGKLRCIGCGAFGDNSKLTTINLQSCEIIGSYCFENCSKLTTLNVPNINAVLNYAFQYCGITELNNNSLICIGNNAFFECDSLVRVVCDNVKVVDLYAFRECTSLNYISLSRVEKICKLAFYHCLSLQTLILSDNLEYLNKDSLFIWVNVSCDVYYYSNTIVADYIDKYNYTFHDMYADDLFYNEIDGGICITGFKNSDSITIPTIINGKKVIKIASGAFSNCSLIENISLTNVKEIGNYAFSSCGRLESVYMPNVTIIGDEAFNNCTSLNSVDVSSVVSIGSKAFYNTNLDTIKFEDTVETIGYRAIGYENGIVNSNFVIKGYSGGAGQSYATANGITFVSQLHNIDRFFFNYYDNNDNTEIMITAVDSYLSGRIVIPSTYNGYVISKIDNRAFEHCEAIEEIVLPNTINYIGDYAFNSCINLSKINLENVDFIGRYAFCDCYLLSKINVPRLENISPYSFSMCSNLKSIVASNVVTVGNGAFGYCYNLVDIYMPLVEEIGSFAFENCISLQSVELNQLKELKTEAFCYCENLNIVYLPNIEIIGVTPFLYSGVNKCYIGKKLRSESYPIGNAIVIYGYANTYAETYANTNGNVFVPIDETEIINDLSEEESCLVGSSLIIGITVSGFGIDYKWYSSDNYSYGGALIETDGGLLEIDSSILGTRYYYVIVTDWLGEKLYSNICSVYVASDDEICVIDASCSIGGSISPSGEILVINGFDKTISFTLNNGYILSNIYINSVPLDAQQLSLVSSNKCYTFTNVSAEYTTIYIEFALEEYVMTIINSDYGTITLNKEIYHFGDTITLYATANNGYHIEGIYVDGISIDAFMANDNIDDITYYINNIVSNHIIFIQFVPNNNTEYQVQYYLENLTSSGKKIGDKYYTLIYTETKKDGVTDNYTAVMPIIYEGFHNLTIEQVIVDPNGDSVVEIFYDRNVYLLEIECDSGIQSILGNGEYRYGESVTLSASIKNGYNWQNWKCGTDTFNSISLQVIMPSNNVKYYACTNVKTYQIFVYVTGGGYTNRQDVTTVSHGDNYEIMFIPYLGNKLSSVVIDGVASAVAVADNNYTLLNISNDHSFYINFVVQKFDVKINIDGNVNYFNDDLTNIEYGSNRDIELFPSEKWLIKSVFVNGTQIIPNDNVIHITDIKEDINIEIVAIYDKSLEPNQVLFIVIASVVAVGIVISLSIISIVGAKKRKRF